LTKGAYKGEFIGDDRITSPANDKEHHHWGQSVGGFLEIVERFTNPGETVLDPFLGGGTTGVACLMKRRQFIGVDIDSDCVETSRQRMQEI
jgi:site-specific DNA-methyltransferase (adenine-specific)